MLRSSAVAAAGTYDDSKVVDTVILDFDGRNKRRAVFDTVKGAQVLLDLADVVTLRMDDGIVLEDGGIVQVVAEAEALLEAKAKDPTELARLAWHLGNRHLNIQVLPNRVRLRRDHVIEDMLKGLGAKVAHVTAPFDPEGGAYLGAVATHGHEHGHDHHHHDHGHDHGHQHHAHHHHAHHHHDHGHHDHGHPDHVHDETCGCGQDHGHQHKVYNLDTDGVVHGDHRHHVHNHTHDHAHEHVHADGTRHSHDHAHHHAHDHIHGQGTDHAHDPHSHGDTDHAHAHGADHNHSHGKA
jgi:urease accessory protein